MAASDYQKLCLFLYEVASAYEIDAYKIFLSVTWRRLPGRIPKTEDYEYSERFSERFIQECSTPWTDEAFRSFLVDCYSKDDRTPALWSWTTSRGLF